MLIKPTNIYLSLEVSPTYIANMYAPAWQEWHHHHHYHKTAYFILLAKWNITIPQERNENDLMSNSVASFNLPRSWKNMMKYTWHGLKSGKQGCNGWIEQCVLVELMWSSKHSHIFHVVYQKIMEKFIVEGSFK